MLRMIGMIFPETIMITVSILSKKNLVSKYKRYCSGIFIKYLQEFMATFC